MVNNSDKPLKWLLDLSARNRALDEGILKFTHPSGAPFVVMSGQESKGIEGTLDPGQTQHVSVAFTPSESDALIFNTFLCLYTVKHFLFARILFCVNS